MNTFYDFKALDNKGKEVDLAIYKGKKVLVVNTASECGYTPQYAPMQELPEKYKDQNLVVLAFPSNDFGAQEPGTNAPIATFCQKNYGVTFPVMSKITVKGTDAHPLYKWLTDKKQNGVLDSEVKWNFQKYLIDENGKLADMAPHSENPLSDRIVNWVTKK